MQLRQEIRILTELTLALAILTPGRLNAGTAENILNYSESDLIEAGVTMANAVSKMAPMQVDSTTTLLGAVFIPKTKTFIYKYNSSIPLNQDLITQNSPYYTCNAPIRRSLLKKGFVIKHMYYTPSGEKVGTVKYADCKQFN